MKKINFYTRIDKKMENLNISEKDIIKYKKSSHFKITSIVFIIIALIVYGILKKLPFYISPSTISIVFSILLVMYTITLIVKFKRLDRCNKVYEYMYSSRVLDNFIKQNLINEANSILIPNDLSITTKDTNYTSNLVNGIELRIGFKMALPIITVLTIIGLISMFYTDGETIASILEYGVFLIFPIGLVSSGYILVFSIIMTSNFKIKSKIQEKTINKLKNYYKLGCIDYLDCIIIARYNGYLILDNDLDTMDYLDILSKYNLSKQQLVEKYIDLKVKEFSDMLFLGVGILLCIVVAIILDSNASGYLFAPILFKYVERKTAEKREKLLTEVRTSDEELNKTFNKICSKKEYFYYSLSYLLSNKAIRTMLG